MFETHRLPENLESRSRFQQGFCPRARGTQTSPISLCCPCQCYLYSLLLTDRPLSFCILLFSSEYRAKSACADNGPNVRSDTCRLSDPRQSCRLRRTRSANLDSPPGAICARAIPPRLRMDIDEYRDTFSSPVRIMSYWSTLC